MEAFMGRGTIRFHGHLLFSHLSLGTVWPPESPMDMTPMLITLGQASPRTSSPTPLFWASMVGWYLFWHTHYFSAAHTFRQLYLDWLAGSHSASLEKLDKVCSDLLHVAFMNVQSISLISKSLRMEGNNLNCSAVSTVVPLCLCDWSMSTKLEEVKKVG